MIRNKVFISTGYYKNENPLITLKKFIKKKIYNIEFSGGKLINSDEINKLKSLSKKNQIRIHNYFPPPKKKFVINLASTNKKIIEQSLKQIKLSILLSKKLSSKFFSFHAGFRIDPDVKKLGKKFDKKNLISKKLAEKIFIRNIKKINNFAQKHKIKILIENNVINKKNLNLFGENPLLLTNPNDILKFFKKAPRNVGLLLDLGHLKVSSKTENFKLVKSLKGLNKIVSGYHLSDNNALEDQNKNFTKKTWFIKYLKKDLDYYTLEIYNNNLNKIKKTTILLEEYLSS